MRKINYRRLLKLATHLEKGELGHKYFNFGNYNNKESECGTSGCAIGECPIVFPKDWEFGKRGNDVILKGKVKTGKDDWDNMESSGKKFFGITSIEYCHLFLPSSPWAENQDVKTYGGKRLTVRAKKEEVATGIREFVKRMRMKDRKKKQKTKDDNLLTNPEQSSWFKKMESVFTYETEKKVRQRNKRRISNK